MVGFLQLRNIDIVKLVAVCLVLNSENDLLELIIHSLKARCLFSQLLSDFLGVHIELIHIYPSELARGKLINYFAQIHKMTFLCLNAYTDRLNIPRAHHIADDGQALIQTRLHLIEALQHGCPLSF